VKIWTKSFGAVLAGLASGAVLVMALTLAATLLFFGGDFSSPPTRPYLVLNLTYSFGAAVLAGWVAAWHLACRWLTAPPSRWSWS